VGGAAQEAAAGAEASTIGNEANGEPRSSDTSENLPGVAPLPQRQREARLDVGRRESVGVYQLLDQRRFVEACEARYHRVAGLDTLAADLAQSAFAAFPIPWIDLELKKFILPETRHISFQARFFRPKSKSRRR
jgi:hypothetical protein